MPEWSTFYTMTGTSSATLSGLMFVVIGMVMQSSPDRSSENGIHVFSTPTVVHFGSALLVSALLLAPWPNLHVPFATIGAAGLAGAIYMAQLMVRTRRLQEYRADLEDWIWYNVLPLVAYGLLAAGGFSVFGTLHTAMYFVAADVLLLIFIAMRNAWDIVTFLAVREAKERQGGQQNQ
jgi:hypothetical protein